MFTVCCIYECVACHDVPPYNLAAMVLEHMTSRVAELTEEDCFISADDHCNNTEQQIPVNVLY